MLVIDKIKHILTLPVDQSVFESKGKKMFTSWLNSSDMRRNIRCRKDTNFWGNIFEETIVTLNKVL